MHEVIHHLKQIDRPSRPGKSKTRLAKERAAVANRILSYTSWATFVSVTTTTFAMRHGPLMRPPERSKPPLCKGEHGEEWVPYPRDHPVVNAHARCHLHYLGRLFEICYNISEYVFLKKGSINDSVTRDILEDLHRDLTLWYDSLIGCLQLVGVKAPHTLSLHAQYHWAVVVLSEQIFTSQIDDEDDATVALLAPVIQAQHMASALTIAELVHQQSVHWGVDHVPISFLQPVNAALAVVVGDLEPSEHKSSFIKLVIALHSMSRRSVSAESMLRMLWLKLRQGRLMSSDSIEKMFRDADKHWEASILSPNVGVAKAPEGVQFGEAPASASVNVDESYDMLIEKWNHFNLGAPSSSSSSSS